MYIIQTAYHIAIPANLHYNESMSKFYEEKITYNQITFRYTKGKSHMTGNEIHPFHEILYYIDGDAVFLSEKYQEPLSQGSLLLIPKNMYHQFHIQNQEKYTRLALSFPDMEGTEELIDSTMSEIKIVRNLNIHLERILQRMCRIVQNTNYQKERCIFLYSAFLMLLAELNMENVDISLPQIRESTPLITECLHYIEYNFTQNITVAHIAKHLKVSDSALSHAFKQELGISLYQYIIKKRLIYAHKLISEGEKPTKIYSACGYQDYPTFYKAYLKMFGYPPSCKK